MTEGNLFSQIGETLIENGYDLVLIRQGEKRPAMDDWTSLDITSKHVAEWAKKHPRANVGIQTRRTPAIDIDVYDAIVAAEMEAWCLEHLSADAPVRIGKAPKRLLVFRSDKPFRKMKSTFVDDAGTKHAVEILGEGQQFVAFGIHPDTKRPFRWESIESPVDLPVDNLPVLTQADAQRVLDAFAEIAKRHGWKQYKGGSKALVPASDPTDDFGDDDALLTISQRCDDLDDADVRDALSLVQENADDYDHWLQVGMALHHQYDGDSTGLEIWHEWSGVAHNYDSDALDAKWESFNTSRDSGKPTTFRYVLGLAKDAAKQRTKDEFERVKNLISSCTDVDELFDSVATKVCALSLQPHQLEKAAVLMQERVQEIDHVKMPIAKIRTALTKKRVGRSADEADKPDWVVDFVWDEVSDCFYSLSERIELSIRSYNARYDRHMLSPEDKALGRAIPEVRAADAALTVYGVLHVGGKVYLPGVSQLVQLDDGWRVNIYDDRGVPECAEAKSKEQKAALRAVLRHFEVLFPDKRERELLISYLAYQVQCPTERINWAVLIQGVEGAGKTWMQNLMAAVIGRKNVGPVRAASLFTDFNGWAEGRKMIFVEEIRVRGHDRYEVLEKIKTNITNDVLEITKKGKDPYSSPNVTCYMMFTNHADALSLSDNDRRYFILSTHFQSKHQLAAFLKSSPSHFRDIFRAVAEHPDVLRGWLMAFQLHAEFDPMGTAPMTADKGHMRDINMSDEEEKVVDLLNEAETPDCTDVLLNATTLPDKIQMAGGGFPKTRTLRAILDQMGFRFLGRFRIEGSMARFYTRRPDLFPSKEYGDILSRIRRIVAGEEPEFL